VNVLVAEDHEHSRDMLLRRLERKGFTVQVAHSAEELYKHTVSFVYDVILVCLSPQEHNRWNAISKVRSQCESVVIACSSVPFQDDREAAMLNGCHAYLPKPVDFSELLNVISALTDTTA